MTTDQNQGARHMRNTGAFPVGPLRDALLKRGHVLPPPVAPNPHVEADKSKAQVWPLVNDPQPTKAINKPRPHIPVPPIEPPMTRADAWTMRNICLYSAGVAVLVGLVLLVAAVVTS